MPEELNERDMIIRELTSCKYRMLGDCLSPLDEDKVADFILANYVKKTHSVADTHYISEHQVNADRKKVLEQVRKPLKKIKGKYLANTPDLSRETAVNHNNRIAEAIDEALAIIEKEGGE